MNFHRSLSVDDRSLEQVVAFCRKSQREVVFAQLGETGEDFRAYLAQLEVVLQQVSTAVAGAALVQDKVVARSRKTAKRRGDVV